MKKSSSVRQNQLNCDEVIIITDSDDVDDERKEQKRNECTREAIVIDDNDEDCDEIVEIDSEDGNRKVNSGSSSVFKSKLIQSLDVMDESFKTKVVQNIEKYSAFEIAFETKRLEIGWTSHMLLSNENERRSHSKIQNSVSLYSAFDDLQVLLKPIDKRMGFIKTWERQKGVILTRGNSIYLQWMEIVSKSIRTLYEIRFQTRNILYGAVTLVQSVNQSNVNCDKGRELSLFFSLTQAPTVWMRHEQQQYDGNAPRIHWKRHVLPSELGRFRAFRIVIPSSLSNSQMSSFSDLKEWLNQRHLLTNAMHSESIEYPILTNYEALVNERTDFQLESDCLCGKNQTFNRLPYQLRFLVHASLSHHPALVLTSECLKYLQEMVKTQFQHALLLRLRQVSQRLTSPSICGPLRRILTDLETLRTTQHDRSSSNNKMDEVQQVIVTPLCVKVGIIPLAGARGDGDDGNRVVRKYGQFADRFAIVRITDECRNSRLKGNDEQGREFVFDKIEHVLREGVRIGGRLFKFLGYSMSQQKSHSCWVYAEAQGEQHEPRPLPNIRKILKDLGRLDQLEHGTSLRAARESQAFSATIATVQLLPHEIGSVDDVQRNGYCFSDGVGMISVSCAKEVMRCLRKSNVLFIQPGEEVRLERDAELLPSAFQVRIGGAKGMLTVRKDFLVPFGKKVILRKSMQKFQSKDYQIELCTTRFRARPVFLNRQLALLLSSLEEKAETQKEEMEVLSVETEETVREPMLTSSGKRLREENAGNSEKVTKKQRKENRIERYLMELLDAELDRVRSSRFDASKAMSLLNDCGAFAYNEHSISRGKHIEVPDDEVGALSFDDESSSRRPLLSLGIKLCRAGFTEDRCTFLANLMECARSLMLSRLRDKARVPLRHGVLAAGVLDEDFVLKENEIFVQCHDPFTGQLQVITGPVIVGRSPHLQPNELRILNAVNPSKPAGTSCECLGRIFGCSACAIDALHDLRDVIVFSQQGERPVPDMMGGGDLDGDLYFVIWDQNLIPNYQAPPIEFIALHKQSNYVDSNEEEPEPFMNEVKNLDDDDELVADMDLAKRVKPFVNFIRYDQLGRVANLHLAWADFSKDGVFSQECESLAKLHSIAADFPKSGKRVVIPSHLKRLKVRPDFMCPYSNHKTYASPKLLGKMYRRVVNEEKYVNQSTSAHSNGRNSDYDHDLLLHSRQKYVSEAIELQKKYNREMRTLLSRFGLRLEAEAFTGTAGEEIVRHIVSLRRGYLKLFYGNSSLSIEQRLAKASAWYQVSMDSEIRCENGENVVVYSFPWICIDELCELKLRAEEKRKIQFQNEQQRAREQNLVAREARKQAKARTKWNRTRKSVSQQIIPRALDYECEPTDQDATDEEVANDTDGLREEPGCVRENRGEYTDNVLSALDRMNQEKKERNALLLRKSRPNVVSNPVLSKIQGYHQIVHRNNVISDALQFNFDRYRSPRADSAHQSIVNGPAERSFSGGRIDAQPQNLNNMNRSQDVNAQDDGYSASNDHGTSESETNHEDLENSSGFSE